MNFTSSAVLEGCGAKEVWNSCIVKNAFQAKIWISLSDICYFVILHRDVRTIESKDLIVRAIFLKVQKVL